MKLLISDKENAHKDRMYPLPWERTSNCFNFKAPTKTILKNTTIKKPSSVTALVIDCVLDDYNFISQMQNLEQLYIYRSALTNLSFLKRLIHLKQLLIYESQIDSLNDVVQLISEKNNAYKIYCKSSTRQEFDARLEFEFEGIYIQSDKYKGDGSELRHDSLCRFDITVNGCNLQYFAHNTIDSSFALE